jgi:hypothetical protein
MLADKIVEAQGWARFDEAPENDINQEHLDFAHKVARVFESDDGKAVLDAMIKKYLLTDIVTANDTQFGAGIKQGRASVVKYILAQMEVSANS